MKIRANNSKLLNLAKNTIKSRVSTDYTMMGYSKYFRSLLELGSLMFSACSSSL